MNLLHVSSLRYLNGRRWQFVLSILGVALGVAVVVSVDLANDSAQRAFELSTETVVGRTTHQIVGGSRGIAEDVFRVLRVGTGLRPVAAVKVAPVVEGFVAAEESGRNAADPSRMLRVLGIDPFSDAPFRAQLGTGPVELDLGAFLTVPGACLLSRRTADRLGVQSGSSFAVERDGQQRTLFVAGVLEPRTDDEAGLDDLVIADIATAQEVLGMPGRLTRIDLIVEDSAAGAVDLDRIRDSLPADATIAAAAARTGTAAQMTRAFRVNLMALGLLALVCGVFLVYNTMSFSVVQRREHIGTLRAIGVTRDEVFKTIFIEAGVIGAAGTLLGVVGGIAIGNILVRLVTQTINDLYFVVNVRDLVLSPFSLGKGVALGFGGTLLAALAPTLEAIGAPPRAVLLRSWLEARARRNAVPLAVSGVILLVLGGGFLLVSRDSLIVSFASIFLTILGFALLSPVVVVAAMRGAVAPMGWVLGPLGRIATRGVVAALSRTAVAIAALMIAVSVIVGVSVMIDSFRATVVRWLDFVLVADLYVSPAATTRVGGTMRLDSATRRSLEAVPGVVRLSTIRGLELQSPGGGRTRLLVFEADEGNERGFEFESGDPDTAWPAVRRGDSVLVTEPYAYRADVAVGDAIVLMTPRGPRDFAIAGIYYNYAAEEGLVAMSRATYARYWEDTVISAFSIDAEPGADLDLIAARTRDILAGRRLTIQSNRSLRTATLEIFDRTFLITGVLRALVTMVAFLGVFSALMCLQLERGREIGVLRALGLTPREVRRLVMTQSGLMGLVSGIYALPVGLTLAAIMVFVINRRSFGWTLGFSVAPAILAQALLIAVGAALLAGIYPARRMARTPPAIALREE